MSDKGLLTTIVCTYKVESSIPPSTRATVAAASAVAAAAANLRIPTKGWYTLFYELCACVCMCIYTVRNVKPN